MEFAILVYDPSRKFSCTGLDALHFALFKASSVNDLRRIPPTEDAFFQHCLRCCYQAGWIWGSTLNKNVGLPHVTEFGWEFIGSYLTPKWKTLPSTDCNKTFLYLVHAKESV